MNTTNVILTTEQQNAVDEFFKFLLSDQKEMVITGSPGTGKTFLTGYLGGNNLLSKYIKTCKLLGTKPVYENVVFTATTNKAAEVLSGKLNKEAFTIHSLLSLKVSEDWSTGEVKVKRTLGSIVHNNTIIFVDECSMIDTELYSYITQLTDSTCKIVYVGDKYQLAPVKEKLSPVFRKNLKTIELTVPVRNKEKAALINVCEQLKETVRTGEFKPIKTVPGVIDWYDPEQMQELVRERFKQSSADRRLLTYSNNLSIKYNNFITTSRNASNYEVGEWYVIASNAQTRNISGTNHSLPVEQECLILDLEPEQQVEYHGFTLTLQKVKFSTKYFGDFKVSVAKDYTEVIKILKHLAKYKNWSEYFTLKNSVIDLRPRDSSTVHKAQGSTLDEVFIDLSDISRCNQSDMAARLLYVAFSRAKNRIHLCGHLKDAYGGIINE